MRVSPHPAQAFRTLIEERSIAMKHSVRSFSCVAFTIRAWSRPTFWLAVCQSMAFQSTFLYKDAPAVIAVICFSLSVDLPNSLVMEDHVEVCSLSCGMMLPMLWLNPYSPDYRATFAFSTFLYPLFYWLALQLAFPGGEQRAYHVSPT